MNPGLRRDDSRGDRDDGRGDRDGNRGERDDGERKKAAKLSYKLQFELDNLPDRIARIEKEIEEIEEQMADPDLYARDPGAFHALSTRLMTRRDDLNRAELRWLELEEMQAAV